ncbi:MAG: SdiA-regulated domain-containing protein [Ignavibacteriota bacterium]
MLKAPLTLLTVSILFFSSCSSEETIQPVDSNFVQIDLSSFLFEPSGITYNPHSNTLFVVSDTINSIFEIDTSGVFINSFTINADDLEGICFSSNYDTIYVVGESFNLISTFALGGTKIKSIYKKVSTNLSVSDERLC